MNWVGHRTWRRGLLDSLTCWTAFGLRKARPQARRQWRTFRRLSLGLLAWVYGNFERGHPDFVRIIHCPMGIVRRSPCSWWGKWVDEVTRFSECARRGVVQFWFGITREGKEGIPRNVGSSTVEMCSRAPETLANSFNIGYSCSSHLETVTAFLSCIFLHHPLSCPQSCIEVGHPSISHRPLSDSMLATC